MLYDEVSPVNWAKLYASCRGPKPDLRHLDGSWLCPCSRAGSRSNLRRSIYRWASLLVKAGGALIDNMAWLFAIGAAVGLADNDGTAGLAGLVSYLMMQQLLSPGVSAWSPPPRGHCYLPLFQKVAGNSFIGILAELLWVLPATTSFKNTQLPDWLAFFSGKRFVAIATGLISILVSVVLLFVWPVICDALVAIGNGIAGMDGIGAGIYAFLNRLLIPTGLHHALNNVFWFDTIGLGDLSHFWAGETSADVGWSLGMYMSGFPLHDVSVSWALLWLWSRPLRTRRLPSAWFCLLQSAHSSEALPSPSSPAST